MDEVHGNGNSSELIKCDLCEYSTTLKRNYRKHVRQMHTKREKLLLCDQCDLRSGQCTKTSFIPILRFSSEILKLYYRFLAACERPPQL